MGSRERLKGRESPQRDTRDTETGRKGRGERQWYRRLEGRERLTEAERCQRYMET